MHGRVTITEKERRLTQDVRERNRDLVSCRTSYSRRRETYRVSSYAVGSGGPFFGVSEPVEEGRSERPGRCTGGDDDVS